MDKNREIGIGIVGAGYMGKAHSVAMHAVGAVFNTTLRPRLRMICTTTEEGARNRAAEFGFERSTGDWRTLVNDPEVEAVVVASTQDTHREICELAFAKGKPVLCEKPLGKNLGETRSMVEAADKAGTVNMAGFNYIRTPASQMAREIIEGGEIGEVVYFRAEHTEDFFANPDQPATWRSFESHNGAMGDLAPHIVNGALALVGPIQSLSADIETVHKTRSSKDGGNVAVTNDDQGHMICRFETGAMGNLFVSRVATGRKMGYAYEVYGSRGSIRFDQEDQNALWLYKRDQSTARQGFTKILTGPDHPDYVNFCQGPGHGTGYQDQLIIEARDFLKAIETGKPVWPTFRDGLAVNSVIEAMRRSNEEKCWINVSEI